MMLIMGFPSQAKISVNGIYYEVNSTTKTAYVTYNSCSGALTIPSSITYNSTTYIVTAIGKSAFQNCTQLTSVTIPNSVTSIGELAFSNCKMLTSITIPNSVTKIDIYAFNACSSLLKLIIEDGTETLSLGYDYDDYNGVNRGLFYDCPLSYLYLGRNLSYYTDSYYGYTPFNKQTTLKTVTIGEYVTSIDSGIFKDCTGITTVNFNAINCKYTYDGIFSSSGTNGALKTVNIGENVKNIPPYAFNQCNGLTKVTIPNSVCEIGSYAFRECANLTKVNILATTPPAVKPDSFYSLSKFYIPLELFHTYETSSIWNSLDLNVLTGNIDNDSEISGTISFSGSGSGTESDPYLIFNPIQLNDVRNSIGHSGVYYKLMSDIDMTEWIAENNPTQGWQPIGNKTNKFKGTFLGNGKKISGLTVSRESADYVGLFGYIYNATISDLEVDGQIIGNNYVGGIVGKSYNSTASKCSFNGNISGLGDCVGGITGNSLNDTYSDCIYKGDINGKYNVGGFAGSIESSTINNFSATGNISGTKFIGGFAGVILENSKVSNIEAIGNISATDNYIGGCVAFVQNDVKISSALHNGNIIGADNVGGFIGYYNTATTSNPISNCKHIGKISGKENVGGLIGNINRGLAERTISNCYAIGDIVASNNNVGGLVGYINSESATTISDSYYSGKIIGNNYIGGLLGNVKNATIETSYSNASLVSGKSNVGGIVGTAVNGNVSSCVAINEKVNASEGVVGRIYGNISGTVIGATGTNEENKAMATTVVNSNGVQIKTEDSPQHGTNVGKSTLKLRSTYQGIGWNWTTNWDNQETESYPYKQDQTAPPVFSNTSKVGETTISGKSVKDGTVYIEIDNNVYSANVVNNAWSVTVEPLQAGATIVAYAKSLNLNESFRISQVVGYAGSGTDDDPYQIHTASDLANVNGGGTYKLMNDIDLTSWIQSNTPTNGWIPLGKNGNVMIKLIGDNHKITGLWCNTSDNNAALIASGQNLTITNLTVEVATDKEVKGGQYSAILVGNATNCTISNCHVKGAINGISHVGGIAGAISDGAVTNSSCDVQISASDSYVGGICGQSTNVDFERCDSKVTASGINYLGGISGTSTQLISNCKASATLNGVNYIGGLVGKTTGTIVKSNASCNIKGICTDATEVCYAGGIAGHSSGDITISYSDGTISQDATSLSCYVGGISGYNEGGNIKDCYSTANISSTQYGAGIVGYNTGSVSNCYASGNISATLFGAGIVGYNDGASAITKNCIAANNILEVSSEKGIAMRVIGGIKNNAPTPDINNYALNNMAVSVNGVTQKIYDDVLHGLSKNQSILMQSATYSSLGWDMISIWGIEEGVGYPFLYKEKVFASSLSIDREEATLTIGDNITLVATILPTDATTKNVKWSSSNEQVAIVDNLGVITAISEGNAVITATTLDGSDLTASCNITVLGKIANYFAAKDMEVNSGSSFVLPIELVNEEAITGFQCDIYLPEGIELEMYDDEYDIEFANRATSSHILSSALQNDGSVRVLAYSTSSKVFSGNNGALFNLKLATSDSFEDEVQIILRNIVMTTPSEVEFKPMDLTITISKRQYISGDTNNDGVINVTDVVRIANYVLGNEPSGFVFEAADIKADGVINVSDIVGVSNLILNGSTAKTLSVKSSQKRITNEAKLSIEDFVITAGESKEIKVKLDNAEAFTALQLDIKLPMGLNLEKTTLKKATSSHVMMANDLSNGNVRILSYSTQNANFKSTNDAFLTLVVKADENFNGGNIVISDILAVENNMKEAIIDDVVATVSAPCGIENIYASTNIYAKERNIVIESPCQQTIYISTIDGVSRVENINAGLNIIPMNNIGTYIISAMNKTKKLIIK